MAIIYCYECGKKYSDAAKNCPACGAPNTKGCAQGGRKSWVAAFLLCLFLAGVGAHRFYLRRTGSAVAMLLISILSSILVIGGAVAFVATTQIIGDTVVVTHVPWAMIIGGLGFATVAVWALVDLIILLVHAGDDDYVTRIAHR